MCGNCNAQQFAKGSEINVVKYNIVIVVLLCITCSSLGISCYALLRVQSLSEDLNVLRIVLSRSEIIALGDRNKFSEHQNLVGGSGRHNEGFANTYQERVHFSTRSKRSLEEAKNLDQTVAPPTLEDYQKLNTHNIKKKAVSNEDTLETETFSPEHQTIYTHRHRGRGNNQLEIIDEYSPKAGRLKSLMATHYNGDTSKYVYGHHSNFNGNGHLRHPQKTFVDWKESEWVGSIGTGSNFVLNNGLVTIRDAGLYFVYSQIYYLDQHDMNGYRVYKNFDVLLQCTTTSHSSERMMKGNTCYTASVTYLDTNDTISVSDITDGRYSLFEPGKSFFGLIKLGDVKIK
ncbi:hypothetical protein WA026_010432 [Henosepilachna vigintioctopunctata]|uniref:THD domain-containing protein n=1 Tax=Henosepilachna vigintioctopunctata TaxID=420089 RepID=A0AAW1V6S1_9CUCU